MKKLWFRRKRYGYGLTPASWEGWITTLVYIFGLVLFFHDTNLANNASSIRFVVIFVIWTILFIAICRIKGEKLRWQWGNDDDEDVL